jgi:hypothetical protein
MKRRIPSFVALLLATALPARADDFPAALAPVFQGDLPQTLSRLQALPAASLSEKQSAARACILERFASASAAPPSNRERLPADLEAVLAAYRRYWTAALMRTQTGPQAETALSEDLGRLFPDAPADLSARTQAAAALAERRGWRALGGVTAPLREYMLWKDQSTHPEAVSLPEGPVTVSVTRLDGFASLGWGAWATCDWSHTGGWTTAQGLMVVVPGWDFASEHYQVSLLGHEAQHFADHPRFPRLGQPDLEYRAKLTELALAHTTQKDLLDRFAAGAKRDRSLPHPFAQWWVMERMGARLGASDWSTWPPDAVRAAAIAALRAHTAELQARGAARVESALPD